MTPSGSGWSGQLAFGPWWFLYSGPIGPTDMHAHHAFQIVVHAGGPCVADNHHALAGPAVVIRPDEAHAFTDWSEHALVAFIDPESRADADPQLSASCRCRQLAVAIADLFKPFDRVRSVAIPFAPANPARP